MSDTQMMQMLASMIGLLTFVWAAKLIGEKIYRNSEFVCRECGSPRLQKLETNGIVRHPGYVCEQCDLQMRPAGSGAFYTCIFLVSLGLCVLFAYPAFTEDGGRWLVSGALIIVVLYSLVQLNRPTPRIAKPSSKGDSQ